MDDVAYLFYKIREGMSSRVQAKPESKDPHLYASAHRKAALIIGRFLPLRQGFGTLTSLQFNVTLDDVASLFVIEL